MGHLCYFTASLGMVMTVVVVSLFPKQESLRFRTIGSARQTYPRPYKAQHRIPITAERSGHWVMHGMAAGLMGGSSMCLSPSRPISIGLVPLASTSPSYLILLFFQPRIP